MTQFSGSAPDSRSILGAHFISFFIGLIESENFYSIQRNTQRFPLFDWLQSNIEFIQCAALQQKRKLFHHKKSIAQRMEKAGTEFHRENRKNQLSCLQTKFVSRRR